MHIHSLESGQTGKELLPRQAGYENSTNEVVEYSLGKEEFGGHLLPSSIFLRGGGILSLLSLDQKCHGISA